MIIYNGNPTALYRNSAQALFTSWNGTISSCLFDNQNEMKNRINSGKPLRIEGLNMLNLKYNNGANYYMSSPLEDGYFACINAELMRQAGLSYSTTFIKDPSSGTVWYEYYYSKESGGACIPVMLGGPATNWYYVSNSNGPLKYPQAIYSNSVINSYTPKWVCHNGSFTTLNRCTVNRILFGGYTDYINKDNTNFINLARNCNINVFELQEHTYQPTRTTNIRREWGLWDCNINLLAVNKPTTDNIALTNNILDRFNLGNGTIKNICFNLNNWTSSAESRFHRNGVYALQFFGNVKCNEIAVNNSNVNWWNKMAHYIEFQNLNCNAGFPGNLLYLFPQSAGYWNSSLYQAGLNIRFDAGGKAVKGINNWTFYQPKANGWFSLNLYGNGNSTNRQPIPNINITGWSTASTRLDVNLNQVICYNAFINTVPSSMAPASDGRKRVLNIENSWVGLYPGTSLRGIKSQGAIGYADQTMTISNSVLYFPSDGVVIESDDWRGNGSMSNGGFMNNVYLTGNGNMQIRMNYVLNNQSQVGDNGFRFNRGNFIASNLNLQYYYVNPLMNLVTDRTFPTNIRIEMRCHFNARWNSTYANAMPVWNNMNGLLRNLFSSVGRPDSNIANAIRPNVTIDIPLQWYTIDSTNINVLKNMLFGNDITHAAVPKVVNANYGRLSFYGYYNVWGTWNLVVNIRRVSSCNYANNLGLFNIWINNV